MKTIKKYFNVAICFLAFAVCSFLLAFSPTMTAIAAIDYTMANYSLAINSMKMPTDVVDASAQDAEFLIPLLDTTFDDNSFTNIVRVVDPTGVAHDFDLTPDATNSDKFFGSVVTREIQAADPATSTPSVSKNFLKVNSLNNGEYKIVYILKSDSNIYYSNTYRVSVKGVSYELDFTNATTNETYLFRPVVKKDNDTFVIPTATLKNTETGGVVTTDKIKVTVTKNNDTLNPADDSDDLTGSTLKFSKDKDDATEAEIAQDNIYTIRYSYDDGSNHLAKTFTIIASNSFTGASELELASTPEMPEVKLGAKGITLPKLAIKNATSNDVAHNVESIEITQDGSNIKQVLGKNDYTFDMTLDAFQNADSYEEMFGKKTYHVKYTAKDAYGKQLIKEWRFDVLAPDMPTVYMSYDYDLDADGNRDTTKTFYNDASSEVKTAYGSSTGVIVPAIYAEDPIYSYNSEDFIIVRYLKKSTSGSRKYYVDNIDEDGNVVASSNAGYNHSDDADNGINKAVTFKVGDEYADEFEGTFEVHYVAVAKEKGDIAERKTDKEMTTIEVMKDTDVNKLNYTPSVEITNILDEDTVKVNDQITVKVSAKDTPADDSVSSKYADKNLKTVLLYYYGAADATFATKVQSAVTSIESQTNYNKYSHTFDSDAFKNHANFASFTGFGVITENEDNVFKFVPTMDSDFVTIAAVTINDNAIVSVDDKTLNIKGTKDIDTPDYEVSYESWMTDGGRQDIDFATGSEVPSNVFKQGVEVVLPKVVFNEDKLQMSVAYYVVEDVNTMTKPVYMYPSETEYKNGNTIYGGVITTDKIGTYNVIYTATDANGNTSVVFFTFEVRDSSNPILIVNAVGDDITQSGSVITAEKGSEIKLETILYSSDKKVNLSDVANFTVKVKSEGLGYESTGTSDYSYRFNSIGTYTIVIDAWYDDTVFGEHRYADTQEITININPVTLEWLDEFNIDEFVDESGKDVYLPMISASDDAEVTVEVKNENNTKIDCSVVTIDGKSYYVFKPESKGIYTVTYTAKSEDFTLTSDSIEIKVGDHIAPHMTFNYEAELAQDIEYKGKDINYTFDVITSGSNRKFVINVSSNGKTIYEYNLGLSISDRDENGVVTTNYSWADLTYTVLKDGEPCGSGKEYTLTGVGKYTLKITIKDKFENVEVKTIDFNVVSKTEAKESNDTVVGAVLIVISLVVLGGVILFFALTGKKSGGKAKKAKKSVDAAVVESKDDEIVIEENDSNDKDE